MTVSVVVQRIAEKVDLEPDCVEDAYPCTSLQAGLLAASLHGVADYTSTFIFEFPREDRDPALIKAAFEVLYDRTPILRTRFFETKGAFWQAISSSPVPWQEQDDLASYLEVDKSDEFELGRDLARFAWINNDNGKSYIVWTLHHALYDEWSINLLFDDFSQLALLPREAASRPTRRPAFSKFIKALTKIDRHASRAFWNDKLVHLEGCRSICAEMDNSFRTSDQLEISCSLYGSESVFQQSTIVVAVWALMISHLSGRETVAFGNIVNGRTADVPGIAEMCGPTMTTVPYALKIPYEGTIETFMTDLEQLRSEMLPHEQTGLNEYRRIRGAAGFDTILSIRSSQASGAGARNGQQIRPQLAGKRDHSHPCALFVDVSFDADKCALKASFDARWIDVDQLYKTLEIVSRCLGSLCNDVHRNLREFTNSLQWPASIRRKDIPESINSDLSHADEGCPLDLHVLDRVLQVVRNVGPLEDSTSIQPDTSLGKLGFDSLQTVVLARRLSDMFQVSVPFRNISGLRKTVSDIAKSMQTILKGSDEIGPKAANISLSKLAEKHAKSFKRADTSSNEIDNPSWTLLTGATGYLGIEILRQYLSSSQGTIILPVRCETAEQGLDRLRRTAEMARWQSSEIAMLDSRTRVWPSDLSTHGLGLGSQHLSEFKNVRNVIHNGARVDFLLDYHDLETTNVASTAFLLSQHLQSVTRPCFVYVTGGRSCPLRTDIDVEATASRLGTANGYAQTKFTSELLLQHAQDLCNDKEREAQMTIVHPGIVIGNEMVGVANTDDFIWRYVAASVRMRAYVPAVPTKREWINLTTVGSVASATLSAMTNKDDGAKVDRRLVLSGLSVARFWQLVIETLGEEGAGLESVSEWEWLRILEDDLDKVGVKHPLFSLSQLILQGHIKGIGGLGPRDDKEERARNVPSAERALVANIRYLKDVGFFSGEDAEQLRVDVFGRSKK